ncbi:MAG: hypothetical protein EBX15_01795 [Acidimicrobiia bacterium]|nr:hypothetical protein [Acidimicrobiia bacterium]
MSKTITVRQKRSQIGSMPKTRATMRALGLRKIGDTNTITAEMLIAKGLIRKGNLVKVLGRGKVSKALSLSVHAVSQTAQEAITAAGGKITILPKPFRGVRPPASGSQFTNR